MTVEHINLSIKRALEGQSNLSQSQLAVRGFSTPTIRRLFSNLCNLENGTYLEVGLFCGATFISSFNSGMTCIGIENYSQDFSVATVKEELEKNISDHSDRAKEVHVLYEDCFAVDKIKLPTDIDIFYYDGEHSAINTAKALPLFIDKMKDTFIYIVDDVRWSSVMSGLIYGFELVKDKCDIIQEWWLHGEQLNDDPIWHNSVAIFLIKKK